MMAGTDLMGRTAAVCRRVGRWLTLALLAAGALLPLASRAASVFEDSMAQRTLPCTLCHGKEGRAGPDGYYPRIAGKPAGYLFNQLRNFRDGRRHYGRMTAMVDPLTDTVNNGAFDWLGKSAQEIFDGVRARPEQPALIVNHPRATSAIQAYFTKTKFDRDTGSSDDPLWSDHFDAIEVFNGSESGGNFEQNRDGPVADWFSLLNHSDRKFWAVGSSDSHAVRTAPVGYPRSFMFVGYDTPATATAQDVRDSIVNGRITVGGGLFMTVSGPGGATPGDTIAKTATADFTVNVACPSWVQADTLEIIVNGETVGTEALLPVGAGPGKAFSNQVTVTLPAGNRAWVLFHAKGTGDLAPLHPGKVPFAVSNPVFFEE